MKRAAIPFGVVLLVGTAVEEISGECFVTCLDNVDCMQVYINTFSMTNNYRVLNNEPCIRDYVHDQDTQSVRSGSVYRDVQETYSATPICAVFLTVHHRTATACQYDKDEDPVQMVCGNACDPQE